MRRFAQRFEKETETTLECFEDGQIGLNIRGSDELVEHGFAYQSWGEIVELAKKQPQLAKRLAKLKTVPLS